MSVTQLNPPLPVEVIDRGKGYAVLVIDYGQEHHLLWCAPNPEVRMQPNWSMGRR